MRSLPKKEKPQTLKKNEQKWTAALMRPGYTLIPSVFLEYQQALGLDSIDMNILLHLAKHWWYKDNPPFPSKGSIAEHMGVDDSTVRRRIAKMEKKGLIKRKARFDDLRGQNTNEYLLDGLITKATPMAHEMLSQQNKRRREKTERRKQRSGLRIVKPGEGK